MIAKKRIGPKTNPVLPMLNRRLVCMIYVYQ